MQPFWCIYNELSLSEARGQTVTQTAAAAAAFQHVKVVHFHLIALFHRVIFHLLFSFTPSSLVSVFPFSTFFLTFSFSIMTLLHSSVLPFHLLAPKCYKSNNTLSLSSLHPFPLLAPLCEQQLEGDLETLAMVTYSSLCVSMLALLLTVLVLSCLRGLKSNTRSIHSNTAAAMFLSELVFLLGVNQTEQQVDGGGVLCACVFCCPVCLWCFCHVRLHLCSFF